MAKAGLNVKICEIIIKYHNTVLSMGGIINRQVIAFNPNANRNIMKPGRDIKYRRIP